MRFRLPRRVRVWRFRRILVKMGCRPDRVEPLATIAAALDIRPDVIWSTSSGLNHWSAWAPQPIRPATHCPTWQGWEPHAAWLDEAPLLERPPSETPADGG